MELGLRFGKVEIRSEAPVAQGVQAMMPPPPVVVPVIRPVLQFQQVPVIPPVPPPAAAVPSVPLLRPANPPAVARPARVEEAFMVGEELERSVQELMSMGFERDAVTRAMKASFNNPARAIEYLLNGIPADAPPVRPPGPVGRPLIMPGPGIAVQPLIAPAPGPVPAPRPAVVIAPRPAAVPGAHPAITPESLGISKRGRLHSAIHRPGAAR